MTDEVKTTLDYIDNIIVPGEPFREPANEYWALACYWEGMRFLFHQVERCEHVARERINSGEVKVFSFCDDKLEAENLSISGRLPEGLSDIPIPLITSAFQWYAISACNFVRLIGAIAKRLDESRPLPDDYAKPIIPEVLAYRNKVAAHPVWSSKNNRDNDAERLVSVLPQISYSKARFRAGSMNVTLRRGESTSNSGAIKEWSLTEVHESLLGRYFPPTPVDGDQAANSDKSSG